MTELRVQIPLRLPRSHKESISIEEGELVGILRHVQEQKPVDGTFPRPLALILHGNLAHKDQLYHRKLAASLSIDSFRFDFRHSVQGGESRQEAGGPGWHMANFADDVVDIHTVVRFLRRKYNYHVECIIAHSRGCMDCWTYFWDIEQRRLGTISNRADDYILDRIPYFVAISGRWRMELMQKRLKGFDAQVKEKGHFDWTVKVAGKTFTVQMDPPMVASFAAYPVKEMVRGYPEQCDALLIHGDQDPTVPVEDCSLYMDQLEHHQQPVGRKSGRPGSTQMHIVHGASHTFKGHFDELIDVICRWLASRREAAQRQEPNSSQAGQAFAERCLSTEACTLKPGSEASFNDHSKL